MAALATLTLAACSTAPTVAPAPEIAKPPVVAPAEMPVEANAPDRAQKFARWIADFQPGQRDEAALRGFIQSH